MWIMSRAMAFEVKNQQICRNGLGSLSWMTNTAKAITTYLTDQCKRGNAGSEQENSFNEERQHNGTADQQIELDWMYFGLDNFNTVALAR